MSLPGPAETPGARSGGSGRRAAGILLVILALIGVIAVTRISGSRTTGIASAPRGATLPSVGDCLESLSEPAAAVVIGGTFEVDSYDEAAATFSHCGGSHVGEVVAFLMTPGGHATLDAPDTGSSAAGDDARWCRLVAEQYAGAALWRFRTNGSTGWQPSTGQRFSAVSGGIPHEPAGSRWATCVVTAPGLEPYDGAYLRSWADEPAPPPFGRCRSGGTDDDWVSCTAPHRTQEFGTRPVQGAAGAAALADCRSLIEVMTGRSNLGVGGTLLVQVVPNADQWSCRLSVLDDRQLVGTLIGIGDQPLPLG